MAATGSGAHHASARAGFGRFLDACATDGSYHLTPRAEATPFARCFAVFGLHLLRRPVTDAPALAAALRDAVRDARRARSTRPVDKSYRQLLTFTLSALAALDALDADPLADLVAEQVPADTGRELRDMGCLDGLAGSGNQAMFVAIFLLHARDRLGLDTSAAIDAWVELHLRHMNRFGFWGPDGGMTHLQFQNGYHQHEILEYLGVANPRVRESVAAVASLADGRSQFAPYPGGGGCYDYDAVFVLTPDGRVPDDATRALLTRTVATLAAIQRDDGGFAESLHVRPRSPANLARFAAHIAGAATRPRLLLERLRYGLTLQRPVHDRIHTHWSRYSRRWDEADLWDSWFRMLAMARIDVALAPAASADWGFIDYPGIGFHPILHADAR